MRKTLDTNQTQGQLLMFPQVISPTTISSLEGFPVSLLVLLESEGDLTTPEEHSSLISQGFSRRNEQDSSYWKTSKGSYLMTVDELSKPSSPRLLSWGMISSGKCLTARISESPRIGKECSLSDILEEHPDPKYFLSERATQTILNSSTIRSTVTKESTEKAGLAQPSTQQGGATASPRSLQRPLGGARGSPHGSKQNWDSYELRGRIRRLTPLECERLQGFPDGWTEGVSDTQRYKQLGNAVTVNVVEAIVKRL